MRKKDFLIFLSLLTPTLNVMPRLLSFSAVNLNILYHRTLEISIVLQADIWYIISRTYGRDEI